ncbi:hypothetical protein [Haloactinomyces albus]|uniref:Uncharacterized protein n=1 Tax=Haloactinomyces albus TaxID=1352928 RepID=A0AAE3ZBY4_9ACTN|nr:hypothetical protein [Haloactinomyces albus]MDR7300314.1 hypothetical protein [Haloactinomyces albus]
MTTVSALVRVGSRSFVIRTIGSSLRAVEASAFGSVRRLATGRAIISTGTIVASLSSTGVVTPVATLLWPLTTRPLSLGACTIAIGTATIVPLTTGATSWLGAVGAISVFSAAAYSVIAPATTTSILTMPRGRAPTRIIAP